MGLTPLMEYYSYADLSELITRNLSLIPRDIDLIVAVPPAGLLAGVFISLTMNRRLIALDAFLSGCSLHEQTFRHALVVHDCSATADAVQSIRSQVAATNFLGGSCRFTHLAPLLSRGQLAPVDLHFATTGEHCQFEWQVLHHPQLGEACVDIDGVLCVDPTAAENDDGPLYREFLLHARPHLLPTQPIRHLVTSRLERWRPETEAWLAQHGVVYQKLSMLNVATAAERRRLGSHAAHKARVYAEDTGATLFIESELHQAHAIAEATGKPALCIANQKICLRGQSSAGVASSGLWRLPRALARRAKRFLQRP
jgi:uncharacterized HAD superfamily protein